MRQFLKSILPDVIRVPLRRGETYTRRLGRWLMAMRQVEGVSSEDQRLLLRSFLASPRTSAQDIDVWQDPQILEDLEIRVHSVGRFRVRARSDDFYHVLPLREPGIVRVMRERLKPGDIFVDAGANIGFYTVLGARLVGDRGRVLAIEMMPDTAEVLRRHVAINALANVSVVERALSDRSEGTVVAHVVPGKFGQASIAHTLVEGRTVEVPCTTLDDLLSDMPDVALMKMDLEGAEALALHGAQRSLSRIGAIIFEQLSRDEGPGGLLRAAGFSIQPIDGNNRLALRNAQ
ncbi:FkbM family methyltransferase [Thermaurantiacus sp.]